METELGQAARAAAARTGVSLSQWLSATAAAQLRNELLGAPLDAWEATDGPFSDAELDDAARVLAAPSRSRRRAG